MTWVCNNYLALYFGAGMEIGRDGGVVQVEPC